MKYDCVYELNPFLPSVPTVGDMVMLKGAILGPAIYNTRQVREITNEELSPAVLITAAVVGSNFNILSRARNKCNKR